MDYSFNDMDLLVKKDVSDLKLYLLFWRRVLGKKPFFRKLKPDYVRMKPHCLRTDRLHRLWTTLM
jgi:hypothetical protein